MSDTLTKGRMLCEEMSPGMEAELDARFGELLPDLAETVVDFAFGRHYSSPGLDIRSRYIAAIAGLTTIGGQTRIQLKYYVSGALKLGISKKEIAETIWQMAIYAGIPAAMNGLNAAYEVFDQTEK